MEDKALLGYLKNHKIEFNEFPHVAVFTVAESRKIKEKIPGTHTKNLFLKDEKGSFYLVCLPALKRLDIKDLEKQLNIKHLTFGSPEELKENLSLTPGSVSIFGMIHATSVSLILDKEISEAELSGHHPNINTATIVLKKKDLEKYLSSLKAKKLILQLKNFNKNGA